MNLYRGQIVDVISGKYEGIKGSVETVKVEGSNHRIELITCNTKEHIYVNKEDINFDYSFVDVTLYMNIEDRMRFNNIRESYFNDRNTGTVG